MSIAALNPLALLMVLQCFLFPRNNPQMVLTTSLLFPRDGEETPSMQAAPVTCVLGTAYGEVRNQDEHGIRSPQPWSPRSVRQAHNCPVYLVISNGISGLAVLLGQPHGALESSPSTDGEMEGAVERIPPEMRWQPNLAFSCVSGPFSPT